MRLCFVLICATTIALHSSRAAETPAPAAAAQAPINTIDELWAGFDPSALPFEIEVVKSQDENDIHLETIYFTGEVFEGEKTRVFGYLGRPREALGKIPGILHIHGGGQTANLDWVRYWARRGYSALSFDFCGNTNLPNLGPEYHREHYTKWGKVPANMMEVSGGRKMTPSPRSNPWFHWALTARRGLSLLESRPEVDPERLGIFGISVGGTLTWIVAGSDTRVKAAVPIYGCGWESYTEYPPQPDAETNEETQQWRKLIAPEAYAPRIHCPVLFMSATNDFHGKMDLGYKTLDLLSSKVRSQVFTVNYDHHIEPAEAHSLPLWFATHLRHSGGPDQLPPWPTTPQIQVTGAAPDGPLQIRIEPVRPDDVERVDIYYALSNDWPMARFWRTVADVRSEEGAWWGEAPFLDPADVVYVFANVSYQNGTRISSALSKVTAKAIQDAKPTLEREALIDAMDTSTDWNWVPAYTDPNQGNTAFFEPWQPEEEEVTGFTLDSKMFNHKHAMNYYFGTRKIADPQFRGAGDAVLAIDCLAENLPEKLTIRLKHRKPDEYGQEFEWAVLPVADDAKLPGSEGDWRTLRFERKRFHNAQGVELPDWEHVEYFILQGTNAAGHPPVFKRLRWEK